MGEPWWTALDWWALGLGMLAVLAAWLIGG
jgi:hypothetical protein